MRNHHENDILIVGAGLIGLTAALALARENFSVVLIDAQAWRPFQMTADYELRVSAVTPASIALLQQLDVWPAVNKVRVAPFRGIAVGDSTDDDFPLAFFADGLGHANLGVVVENHLLQQALWEALSAVPQVKTCMPTEISHWETSENHLTLHLKNGESLTGRLLIGADGASSCVRQLANISVQRKDYEERALVATIQTELSHDAMARQRFLPTGPVALLPLPDNYHCSLVWTTPASQADQLKNMAAAEFNAELQMAFGQALGKLQVISKRLTFPLQLQHAHRYIQERVALMGDAAHVIHPMAGQGVNLGWQDVMTLVRVLKEARQRKRDIGQLTTLRRYERHVRAHNQMMLTIVDKLHMAFQFSHPLLSSLRHQSLQQVAHWAPLKQLIVRYAMGLTEDE